VREGRRRLEELLGGLGSLEATEVSGLSAVSEDGETSVDLVPVRGPTPEEDSLASSASPFPSSRMDRGERMEEGRRGSDLATVAGLVARIRQQREAMEERSNLAKPQPQALLPILPPSGAKERGQYKMNKDFIQKVLDFSRSSSLSETEVKVNVLVHPATSPSPQVLPAARPRRVRHKPREKRKEGGLEQRGKEERGGREVRGKQVGQSKVDGYGKGGQGKKVEGTAPPDLPWVDGKQEKLRYYVEKLLQLKHEEVAQLSSASTPGDSARKQVRFVERAAETGHREMDTVDATFEISMDKTVDSTLYTAAPTVRRVAVQVQESVRRVEVEVQESVSHTSDLLLSQSVCAQVSSAELQGSYRRARQLLTTKLGRLERAPSPACSSGPLSPSTLEERLLSRSSSLSLSRITFSELTDMTSASSGTATLSHIDVSEDGATFL